MQPSDAVQLASIFSIAMSLLLVPELWKSLDKRIFGLLVVGSFAGFPLGLWSHWLFSPETLKLVIGVTAAALALLLLTNRQQAQSTIFRLGSIELLITGIISGAMTSALAMPGPAVLVLMLFRGADQSAIQRHSPHPISDFLHSDACAPSYQHRYPCHRLANRFVVNSNCPRSSLVWAIFDQQNRSAIVSKSDVDVAFIWRLGGDNRWSRSRMIKPSLVRDFTTLRIDGKYCL